MVCPGDVTRGGSSHPPVTGHGGDRGTGSHLFWLEFWSSSRSWPDPRHCRRVGAPSRAGLSGTENFLAGRGLDTFGTFGHFGIFLRVPGRPAVPNGRDWPNRAFCRLGPHFRGWASLPDGPPLLRRPNLTENFKNEKSEKLENFGRPAKNFAQVGSSEKFLLSL